MEGMPQAPSRRPRIRGAMAGAAEDTPWCGISFQYAVVAVLPEIVRQGFGQLG